MSAEPQQPSPVRGKPAATRRRWCAWQHLRWLLLLPAGLLAAFAADRWLDSDKVLRGVGVGEVALGGLDRAGAQQALVSLAGRLRSVPLAVQVQGRALELGPAELGFRLDVPGTLARAMAEGRRGSLLAQLGWWLASFRTSRGIEPVASLDPFRLRAVLARWEQEAIADLPFEGAVVVRDGVPAADYPRPGNRIDVSAAERALLRALVRAERPPVEVPLRHAPARGDRASVDRAVARARRLVAGDVVLDDAASRFAASFSAADLLGALRSRPSPSGEPRIEVYFEQASVERLLVEARRVLDRPPEDATIEIDERDRSRVVPSRPGTRLDAAAVAAALAQAASLPERRGALPIARAAEPEITSEELEQLGIRGLVSKFTTAHACCQPRVQNIHRIADLLGGVVLRPGATLSLNDFVGERTAAKGFVPAPSIEDGEMVDTVGGGISQFATTFFNAFFHGGYEIVERAPHTYYFRRYPMGHEATLSWPRPDLVVRNDTAAGVLIDTSYTRTTVTVRLFGDNGGRKIERHVSRVQDVVKPPLELLPNPELLPDDAKVKERGSVGWSVVVARILTYPDGTTKRERRKVTYKPRVRRVEVHPCRIPEGQPGYTGEKCPGEDGADAGTGEIEPGAGGGGGPEAPEDQTQDGGQ